MLDRRRLSALRPLVLVALPAGFALALASSATLVVVRACGGVSRVALESSAAVAAVATLVFALTARRYELARLLDRGMRRAGTSAFGLAQLVGAAAAIALVELASHACRCPPPPSGGPPPLVNHVVAAASTVTVMRACRARWLDPRWVTACLALLGTYAFVWQIDGDARAFDIQLVAFLQLASVTLALVAFRAAQALTRRT